MIKTMLRAAGLLVSLGLVAFLLRAPSRPEDGSQPAESSPMDAAQPTVAALKALGAEMSLDEDGDVEHLTLSGPRITDAALRQAARLPKLRGLSIGLAPVTDAGLVHLKAMRALRRLGISRCPDLTDAGLAHLEPLDGLEYLGLHYFPELTDAGLAHLEGLTHLQMLEITESQVTDEGLVHLKDLRDLERLYIYDTPLTGAGLRHLKGLTKLEILLLRGVPLTDAGLEHLEGFGSLRQLVLGATTSDSYTSEVTEAGLARLARSLPGCRIER